MTIFYLLIISWCSLFVWFFLFLFSIQIHISFLFMYMYTEQDNKYNSFILFKSLAWKTKYDLDWIHMFVSCLYMYMYMYVGIIPDPEFVFLDQPANQYHQYSTTSCHVFRLILWLLIIMHFFCILQPYPWSYVCTVVGGGGGGGVLEFIFAIIL